MFNLKKIIKMEKNQQKVKKARIVSFLCSALISGVVTGEVINNIQTMNFWKYLVVFMLIVCNIWSYKYIEPKYDWYGYIKYYASKILFTNVFLITPIVLIVLFCLFGIHNIPIQILLIATSIECVVVMLRLRTIYFLSLVYLSLMALVFAWSLGLSKQVITPLVALSTVFVSLMVVKVIKGYRKQGA